MLKPLKGQQRALGARTRSQAILLSRVWLYGPTDGGSTATRSVSVPVPDGASYVDARAVGGGGGLNISTNETGGGAAYARGGSSVSRNGSVDVVVAGQTASDLDGAASTAAISGRVFVKAAGGKKSAASSTPGVGASAADCIGEKIVAGGAGTSGGVSGVAGGDGADPDSLGIGGYGLKNYPTRMTDGTVAPMRNGFGCGSSLGGSSFMPTYPSDAGWTRKSEYGGPGVVVLEFWSKKPA